MDEAYIELNVVTFLAAKTLEDWRLTDQEAAALVHINHREWAALRDGNVPINLSSHQERRLRLCIEITRKASALLADATELVSWLRTSSAALQGHSPLAAMFGFETALYEICTQLDFEYRQNFDGDGF